MQLDIPIHIPRTVRLTDEELARRVEAIEQRIEELRRIQELHERAGIGLTSEELAEGRECFKILDAYRDRLKYRNRYRRAGDKIRAQQAVRRSNTITELTPEQKQSRREVQAEYESTPKGKAARRRANERYKAKRRSLPADILSDEEKEDAKMEAALQWIFEGCQSHYGAEEQGGAS